MNKIILGIILLVALGLGGFYYVNNSDGGLRTQLAKNQTTSDETQQATPITLADARFTIENMTCVTCPVSVRKAMMRVDGVKEVEVDFDSKIAAVTYDAARTNPVEIAAASTDVGYPASLIDS